MGQAGFTLGDVVRLNDSATGVDALLTAEAVYGERLAAAGCRPARTLVGA